MDSAMSQKDKIAAAKKKLRKFQQKAARLDRTISNGSTMEDADNMSQVSDAQTLQIHQQTIDILVEEKAELMKSRDQHLTLNQQLQDEVSVLKSQLHTTNSTLLSLEKKKKMSDNLSTNLNQKVTTLEDRCSSLTRQIENLVSEMSSVKMERDELSERVQTQLKTNSTVTSINNDMTNVPNPFRPNEQVVQLTAMMATLTGEKETLHQLLANRELQYDAMAGQAAHQKMQLEEQLGALQNLVSSRDNEICALKEEVERLGEEGSLEEEVKFEEREESVTSVEDEVDRLQSENTRLASSLEEQIISYMALEKQLSNLQESHVDKSSLLKQINNDKATISRAMGQNKQLKEQLLNLEDKLLQTSETNATLANEVQQLSAHNQLIMTDLTVSRTELHHLKSNLETREETINSLKKKIETFNTEDRLLSIGSDNTPSLLDQISCLKIQVSALQSEKAILALSANQIDSVKAMNVALQERVNKLQKSGDMAASQRETELVTQLEEIERQYNSAAVEERMLEMQTKERMEREKQREFLDAYYEERMKEQIIVLEERISGQTRQFKQYITEIQVSHEDEVEALRKQLSELQHNFRTSLHTQYTQLVSHFTTKGHVDIKNREEELHAHYMTELSRLYTEMTSQLLEERQSLRARRRTQSDEISCAEEFNPQVEKFNQDWEMEKKTLECTIEQLEEEIIKIEDEDLEEEEESDSGPPSPKHSKEERKLQARINVLEMQLSRAHRDNDKTAEKYQHEILRQNQIIQRQQQYLIASPTCSLSQNGPLSHDLSSTEPSQEFTEFSAEVENHKRELNDNLVQVQSDHCSDGKVPENHVSDELDCNQSHTELSRDRAHTLVNGTESEQALIPQSENIMQSTSVQHSESANCQHSELIKCTKVQHADIEQRLQCLLDKVPEGGQYVEHMKKLQERFVTIMKDNANLSEKLKDVEHQNTLLEGETDCIGEYITLYQSQRKALRLQFQQKDSFINKLLNERSTMQSHITRLQQLVIDLPCVEDSVLVDDTVRTRSDSISSNISTMSIMSTTKDEMLEIIGKLKLKKEAIVGGPVYSGSHGPIRDV